MSEHYLPAIRNIQPQGPYLLGGYSLGGLVAMEMAQALQAAGEEVGLLALLDTQIQPKWIAARQWPQIWRRRLRHHLAQAGSLPAAERLPYLSRRITAFFADLSFVCKKRQYQAPPPEPDLPDPAQRVAEAGRNAIRRYRPRRFNGTLTFLCADEQCHLPAVPEIIWGNLAARLVLCDVGGDHWTMLHPAHLDTLAGQLSRLLPAAPSPRARQETSTMPEVVLCMS